MPFRLGRRPRGRGLPAPRAAATLALAALFFLPGCTFERRPDVGNGDTDTDTGAVTRDQILRDSVEAAVATFTAALRSGDVARGVSLLHEQATLYDEETGHRWDPTAADSLLPGPMELDGEQLRWRPSDLSIEVFEDAALVVRRYRATISGEEAPWAAMETYVLVRSDERWMIRHLHRSRGPEPEG